MISPACYHLLLAMPGGPVRHGWLGSDEVGRAKFRD
ncbi:hypothetical protein J2Z21_008901 [Streptomyces griseochromogenes]|uniref:Uncharacterized protein n=1 Tax=Streptomyces griseochromogenes TaxID=68214 RepID=A0ABS4M882_9ACTN|nr:hypothetical protein [Streptomyces griseochromogenes]